MAASKTLPLPRRRKLRAAAVALALLVPPGSVWADTLVQIRTGNHPGFGRVVFDAPRGAQYRVVRDGDTVTVQFLGDVSLENASRPPHNVMSLQADHAAAQLTLLPGSTYHTARLGQHVVIDVFDPAPADGKAPPSQAPAAQSQERPAPDRSAAPAPARGWDVPDQAATGQAALDQAAPEQAAAGGRVASPRAAGEAKAASRPDVPALPLPPPALPSDAADGQAVPGQTVPGQTVPGQAVPGQAVPGQTPAATAALTPGSVADVNAALGRRLPVPPPPPADLLPDSSGSLPVVPPAPPAARPQAALSPGGAALLASAQPEPVAASNGAAGAEGEQPGAVAWAARVWPAASQAQPSYPAGQQAVAVDADASAADPPALTAVPVALPEDTKGVAFSVPFTATVGAAAFRRRGETLIVFDERRPIDLTHLPPGDATGAQVILLPMGTLIRMTPPAGTAVSLAKTPQGWTVAALAAPPQPAAIAIDLADNRLRLAAAVPGRVLTVADPETGDPLLVGTQLEAGQAVVTPRHAPQFTLLRTAQGIVVAPLADAVTLRVMPDGFTLAANPDQLALSPRDVDVLGDAAALTRRFDFPNLPPDQLLRGLSADIAAAGAVPLLARGPMRRTAALTMLSLGMAVEAEALLQLTAADDPREAASADITGLTAIAAILGGRLNEADGIDDPRLTGTDEVTLWRALHSAMRDETSHVAAASLAGTAALLLAYPPAIRDHMLPIAAETMVRGGAIAAAQELLARAGNATDLALARAMLKQAVGDAAGALAIYDRLAAGSDQLLHARAAVQAVELRLATHQYDTRQGAEALDRLLYAWRGDQRELDLRETLASLRQKLGEWREALALLRDAEPLFPADAKAIHARLQATFDALLQGEAADKLPAIEFVALVAENADLVPNTALGEAMQAKLADRLLALDLPQQAGPVLDKLMRAAPAGAVQATYGGRLAALRLREDDASGALAALTASEVSGLPAALMEQRTLLRSDAKARLGDVSGAISALSGLQSIAADAERATIYEDAKDWLGAEHALTAYAAKVVPATGSLDDNARRVLLRLATAAARAGDQPTLAMLRDTDDQRVGSGPLAEMFRLLTEDGVHGIGDLPRAGREIGYARGLPANLQAMQPVGAGKP